MAEGDPLPKMNTRRAAWPTKAGLRLVGTKLLGQRQFPKRGIRNSTRLLIALRLASTCILPLAKNALPTRGAGETPVKRFLW